MKQALKKECSVLGISLLIYKILLNTAVSVAVLIAVAMYLFAGNGMDTLFGELPELVSAYSGWGYLLAIAAGAVCLLIWKKPDFCVHQILKKGRPMTFSAFMILLCLFMSGQLISQVGIFLMDGIFGIFGYSVSEYMASNGVSTDHFSMLLYVGFAAPIFEEILFRGLVLRSLEPYGKRMAILISALLFGFYHGNPVQAPYAAIVGMVLGYVAMEYHILWAMVLHMFNNLIFAHTLPRLLQNLPVQTANGILYAVMIAFALAAVIILLVKHRQVIASIREDPIQPWQYDGAFTSPMLLVLIGSCVLDMILFLVMMFISA